MGPAGHLGRVQGSRFKVYDILTTLVLLEKIDRALYLYPLVGSI